MKCIRCHSRMDIKAGKLPVDGVAYHYYACSNCGEQFLDMKQLHAVAQYYRKHKKFTTKVSKSRESVSIHIPKPLAQAYKLKPNQNVSLVADKKAIKIIS